MLLVRRARRWELQVFARKQFANEENTKCFLSLLVELIILSCKDKKEADIKSASSCGMEKYYLREK